MATEAPESVVRTACTRDCPDACQVLATVKDGRVVRLQGDPKHPITRGFLCYRTDHFLERQYSEERLTTPLIRKNGALEPASWDEALDLVAKELTEARDVYGAQSIFHYQSGGSLGMVKTLNRLLFEAIGPYTKKRGDICSGAGDAAQMTDMGEEDAHDLSDLEHSKTIVLWGKNVAETGTHLIPHLKAAKKRGARIIQIDPCFNEKTLQLSDTYYAIRPGGDGFLALGIARALFEMGAVAKDAESYCDGFEAFSALAHRFTVAEWAARADLPESSVREIAALYGLNTPAALFVGWGMGRRLHGSAAIRLLDALGAITGNLGTRGGGVSYYFKRRGGFDSVVGQASPPPYRTLLEPLLGEELLNATPKVRVAVVDNGNPVSQLPDSTTVAKGLSSVDFLVVLDAFLTDTAELAHVVLPTSTMLEEHDVVGAYGHAYVQLSQPAVPPPAGVRSDFQVYKAIAQRMGLESAFRGDEVDYIDRMLAPMAEGGVTREKLVQGGLRKPKAPVVMFEDKRFPTATGKFQLITDFPSEPVALEPDYPLHLLSIATHKTQASQRSRKGQEDGPGTVIVHPDAANGKKTGDRALLSSPLGEVEVVLELDARQRRDVVIYHKGRWAKYGGPNALIRARVTDAGEGAAYYDQGVRLR
jgi:anaerobic selenocysteine-containing dehydrogenase